MADEITVETTDDPVETTETIENPEVTRLKAELAKAKAATDKATKEAGDYKKQLRAKQTAEEAKAEEEAESRAALEKEVADLRKEKAVANTSKKVFIFVQDEEIATAIAELLYGAEDADAAIDAIGKAWTAREKALRLEYGKIPAPGVGGGEGNSLTKSDILKIKDSVARQKAIAENIHLFR